jgi:hypothetical protein
MAELDSITVDTTRYKLEGIAGEMQATLLRSSFSPIVKEGLDASASLFDLDGTTLAQSCSIPIHLATLIPAVAKIIEIFPSPGCARATAISSTIPIAAARICPISPWCSRSCIAAGRSRSARR